MAKTDKSGGEAAELQREFEQFLKKYRALEAEKEKLLREFLEKTDAAVAKALLSGIGEK
jgi:molybdenum-dependent DNA-binding transcriptional regulator ModE